jgi:valyl-tRNA synthetase
MDNSFKPAEIEQQLYSKWERLNYFAPPQQSNGEDFCILIPPPNITGTLHMGHAFNHTLIDILIRHSRMKGERTLWQAGTDHAGIATQMLVERKLAEKNQNKSDLGREKFIDKVWEWRRTSGTTISEQIRRMGSSIDWSRERFTMDDDYADAVIEVFVRLYDEGLIYRGKRLVNWDPELRTAISDLEVENTEEDGHLWHIRYPLSDNLKTKAGLSYLVVATTRPETMLGDSAIAVHPDDERYQGLVSSFVALPLCDRKIPIIADDYVDPEFGTGCVKITPAHDFNDNEIGKRHDLPLINILTEDAHINQESPIAYQGLDRFDARKKIIRDLEDMELLETIEDHKLMVPRGDRSGSVIEPLLTDQWFVKIDPLASEAVEVVKQGKVRFVPKQYENLYFSWMNDIQDWCISRQQWWGHQIPAFYDSDGNVFVAKDEQQAREKYSLDSSVTLNMDEDVLETWFSSALWPFATMGWPDSSDDLNHFLPSSTLITGHDIIFFWVARMIMMTLHFTDKVPFETVYIHGIIRDADGQKMSKTKGNGLDPLDFIDGISLDELVQKRTSNLTQPQMAERIEKSTRQEFADGIQSYGTDALRFTFASLATTGKDARFDVKRLEGYRNFCNKLWNAAKFVLANTENYQSEKHGADRSSINSWINTKTNNLIKNADYAIDTYRFDLYANHLYEFIWHEYCDWFLEFSKTILWDENQSESVKIETQKTMLEVLEAVLRLAHPVIPFITETIWLSLAKRLGIEEETIMLESFPSIDDFKLDQKAHTEIEWLKSVVSGIRNIRGESRIKPSTKIEILLQNGSKKDQANVKHTQTLLMRSANVDKISWLEANAVPPAHALCLIGDLKLMVPLSGLIDINGEFSRIDKELSKNSNEVDRLEKKLSNNNFIQNAPNEVVEKEKNKLTELKTSRKILLQQVKDLESLKSEPS